MRQDLLDKLCDPSIVQRYEIPYDHKSSFTSAATSDDRSLDHPPPKAEHHKFQTNEDHPAKQEQSHAEEFVLNFSLHPTAAMALTRQENAASSNITADSITRTSAVRGLVGHGTDEQTFEYPPEYPSSWNYLSLRHKQNCTWATCQFESGVSYAKAAMQYDSHSKEAQALTQKAEDCYKKGLDMIPHHLQILTAYGALCINDGRLEQAKKLLQRVLGTLQHQQLETGESGGGSGEMLNKNDLQETLKDAKTYMAVVESRLQAQKVQTLKASSRGKNIQLSNKAAESMNDVLAERAFVLGEKSSKGLVQGRGNYDLLSLSESSHDENDEEDAVRKRKDNRDHSREYKGSKHSRKSKRLKRESKRKRCDRRERHGSPSSLSRRRKSRRRGGGKRRYEHDDDSSSDDSRRSIYSKSSHSSSGVDGKNKETRRRKEKKKRKKKDKRSPPRSEEFRRMLK